MPEGISQMYIIVNILKIRELFVHFKSYLLKSMRQYELLCCLLAKIRAFLRNWSILGRHFIKGSVWKMAAPDRCLILISLVRSMRSGDGGGSS